MKKFSKSGNGMLQVMALVMVLGFNLMGCSKVQFTQDKAASNNSSTSDNKGDAKKAAADCFTETFQVPPNPNLKPVDVLFVLETSQSMGDIRQTIINGINGFVAGLPANADFNIGVMLSHGSTSNLSGRLFSVENEPIVLKTSELSKADIQTLLTAKIMQAPPHAESGGGEEGMFSLFNGITNPTLLAESQTAGFFRPNAALGVVFIADRRDICAVVPAGVPAETDPVKIAARIRDCEGLTAAGLKNRLDLLKGSQPLLVTGIIYADSPAPVGKEIGYGYTDVIALGGGAAIDIANDNITAGLQQVTALAGDTPGQNEFTLAHPDVDPATIEVTVNGQPVPFTYDGVKVTITVPVPAGSTVVINYCLKGDNPFVGLCKVFENAAQWDGLTPTPSTEDLVLRGKSGQTSVGAVRNLQVQGVSGSLNVQSAMMISSMKGVSGNTYVQIAGDIGAIQGMSGALRIDKAEDVTSIVGSSGTLQLNARTLGLYKGASGDACLRVTSVGKVQSSSGTKTIIAEEIEELSAQSGEVHVYGAVVKSVVNTSGKICLHNGATVLNSSNVSGFIGECN